MSKPTVPKTIDDFRSACKDCLGNGYDVPHRAVPNSLLRDRFAFAGDIVLRAETLQIANFKASIGDKEGAVETIIDAIQSTIRAGANGEPTD